MNDLSTAINNNQQGEGGIKENPPHTPPKENKGRNSLFTIPIPIQDPNAPAYAHAQGTPPDEGMGMGMVKINN